MATPQPPPAASPGLRLLGPAALLVASAAMIALEWPLMPLLAHLSGEHPILFVTAVLPFFLLYGIVGRDYGIHRLFWHEFPRRRFVAAISFTLLVVNFVAVAYFTAVRRDDPTALDHLRRGLFGLTAQFRDVLGVDLLRIASWADGMAPADFQAERFGRFLVFLVVTASPPIAIATLPAFFPGLVRLSSPGSAPRQRLIYVAAWLAGVGAGLVIALVLVLLGDRLFGVSIRSFLAVGAAFLLAVALIPPLYNWVTSAFAICLVFSFLSSASAAFICLIPRDGIWTIAAILASVAVVTLSNSNPFKFKFPRLEGYYKKGKLAALEPVLERPASIDSRTNDDDALAAWSEGLAGLPTERRKLVVVAVSGGATRSAIWTSLVLGAICREIPGFARHIRVISGASGGMVGTAYFVKAMKEYLDMGGDREFRDLPAESIETIINRDSLDAVAKQLALRDAPSILFPWPQKYDRGKALEKTWRWPEPWCGQAESTAAKPRNDPGLMIPFSDLAEAEMAGAIPSLIFSPMLVEDGRRLLISNLDLPFMTIAAANALVDPATEATYGHRLSTSAIELATLLGDDARRSMLVSTAVRMSASFPYVSPAVKLPTSPARRVVDAGYYDNYGISVAASWLYHHRDHLRAIAPGGVLLVQVRDQVSKASRLGAGPVKNPSIMTKVSEAFSFLTSPPSGAESARVASTSFRNDEGLMILSNLLNRDGDDFFTTASFEAEADVAVSWALSDDEVELLKANLQTQVNVDRLDRLVGWWSARPPHPSSPT